MITAFERQVMKRLIRLASQKRGLTKPNPMVAAAVIKANDVIAIGVHECSGGPHAEVIALQKAGERARGATVLVTLEPCTHTGQTPPCCDALIQAGVKTVKYAINDPSAKVRQRPAAQWLTEAGINVVANCMEPEARRLNDVFFCVHEKNKPFITVKVGQSLDGKIALSNGVSQYITGEKARKEAHKCRREADIVLVGAGTVRADNPRLDVRYKLLKGYQSPHKGVVSMRANVSQSADMFADGGATIIMDEEHWSPSLANEWAGIATLQPLPFPNGKLDWSSFMAQCISNQWHHVLIEGGSALITSALAAGVVNQVIAFIAPKILGSRSDLSWVDLSPNKALSDCIELVDVQTKMVGNDIMMSGYV